MFTEFSDENHLFLKTKIHPWIEGEHIEPINEFNKDIGSIEIYIACFLSGAAMWKQRDIQI